MRIVRIPRRWRQDVVAATLALLFALTLLLAMVGLTQTGQPSHATHPQIIPSHSVRHTGPATADGDTPTPDTSCGGGVGTHC